MKTLHYKSKNTFESKNHFGLRKNLVIQGITVPLALDCFSRAIVS